MYIYIYIYIYTYTSLPSFLPILMYTFLHSFDPSYPHVGDGKDEFGKDDGKDEFSAGMGGAFE
jgi:hypothetical protein